MHFTRAIKACLLTVSELRVVLRHVPSQYAGRGLHVEGMCISGLLPTERSAAGRTHSDAPRVERTHFKDWLHPYDSRVLFGRGPYGAMQRTWRRLLHCRLSRVT